MAWVDLVLGHIVILEFAIWAPKQLTFIVDSCFKFLQDGSSSDSDVLLVFGDGAEEDADDEAYELGLELQDARLQDIFADASVGVGGEEVDDVAHENGDADDHDDEAGSDGAAVAQRRTVVFQHPRRERRAAFPRIDHPSISSVIAGATHRSYIRRSTTYGATWQDLRGVCCVHPQCTLSRSCRNLRPVGLIFAWLEAGPSFQSKAAHKSYKPDYSTRVLARQRFAELPGSDSFLAAEADLGPAVDEPHISM